MKDLKNYWGIFFFVGVALSVIAYWWYATKKKCTLYWFQDTQAINMSQSEKDEYFKKVGDSFDSEPKAVADLAKLLMAEEVYSRDDDYFSFNKEHLKILADLYDKKGLKYEIKCAPKEITDFFKNAEIEKKEYEKRKAEARKAM
jgi:hypothetical protein